MHEALEPFQERAEEDSRGTVRCGRQELVYAHAMFSDMQRRQLLSLATSATSNEEAPLLNWSPAPVDVENLEGIKPFKARPKGGWQPEVRGMEEQQSLKPHHKDNETTDELMEAESAGCSWAYVWSEIKWYSQYIIPIVVCQIILVTVVMVLIFTLNS